MNINALSAPFDSVVNCIKSKVKITDPYTGAEVETLAIWDTGAQNTVITKSKANELGLTRVGRKMIRGVHGTKEVDEYVAKITLNNENISVIAQVTECDELSASGDTSVLIGMNIISMGDFAISNKDGKTLMSFRVPSLERTDYVADLSEYSHCSKVHKIKVAKGLPDKCACGSGKLFANCHGKKYQ